MAYAWLIFVLCFCVSVQAQEDTVYFDQAYQALQVHEYDIALQKYSQIEQKDFAVWYNVFHIFTKQGRSMPEQLYALSQAYNQAKNRDEYVRVLMQARDIEYISTNTYWLLWCVTFLFAIPLVWYKIGALCLVLWFLQLWYTVYCKCISRFRLVGRALMIIVWLTAMQVSAYFQNTQMLCLPYAAEVYVGPDQSFPVQSRLDAGACVQVVKKHDTWCLVRYAKRAGWIPFMQDGTFLQQGEGHYSKSS